MQVWEEIWKKGTTVRAELCVRAIPDEPLYQQRSMEGRQFCGEIKMKRGETAEKGHKTLPLIEHCHIKKMCDVSKYPKKTSEKAV